MRQTKLSESFVPAGKLLLVGVAIAVIGLGATQVVQAAGGGGGGGGGNDAWVPFEDKDDEEAPSRPQILDRLRHATTVIDEDDAEAQPQISSPRRNADKATKKKPSIEEADDSESCTLAENFARWPRFAAAGSLVVLASEILDESTYGSVEDVIKHRKKCKLGPERNVARVTLRNGEKHFRSNVRFQNGEKDQRAVYHSERALVRMLREMIDKNWIKIDDIVEIYSERQPCMNPGQYCSKLLRDFLGAHYDKVRISYSFPSDADPIEVQRIIRAAMAR